MLARGSLKLLQRQNGFIVRIPRVWSRDRKAVKKHTVVGAKNNNDGDKNNNS